MASCGSPGLADGPARDGRVQVWGPVNVLDSLAASIAIIDEAGTILAVNRAWHRFAAANAPAGARIAEGANYLRACDEAEGEDAEVAAAFASGIREVLAGRRAEFAREYPCHGPGHRRWFIGRVTRLGDGPGRALVAHEDITGRKLMEESLARSEARLRTVLDHVQAAIFLKDLEGRYLLVNRPFAELFDVGEEWVIGKSDRDFLPAGVADLFRANDRQALEALAPTEFEEVVTHADGRRTSLVIKVPLLGADGAPFAVCGIATDITERKKTELALRESESVLRSFYDGVPAALAVAEVDDEDVRVILANATMVRLLGWPADETRDHQFAGLEIPGEHRRRWLDAYQEASCTGRPDRFELAWATREGRGWFAAMVNPIAVEPGARPRFWVTIEDITERKKSEREIFVLNAELEERLERISSLREIDLAITGSLDLPLTLGVVVDQVRSAGSRSTPRASCSSARRHRPSSMPSARATAGPERPGPRSGSTRGWPAARSWNAGLSTRRRPLRHPITPGEGRGVRRLLGRTAGGQGRVQGRAGGRPPLPARPRARVAGISSRPWPARRPSPSTTPGCSRACAGPTSSCRWRTTPPSRAGRGRWTYATTRPRGTAVASPR